MTSPRKTPLPRHDFTLEEIDQLEDHLYEHNTAATGHRDGLGLGFEMLDDGGAQIGAIAGHSWGRVAEIKQLWVDRRHRGHGYGLALLDAALAEARARGCRKVFLQSYDFQAPGLYERRGFTRLLEIPGWPEGHMNVLLGLSLD
jgi:ribosomal protein S18 acetylase RimI-like enzyme